MEEDDDISKKGLVVKESFNLNNLKIFYVKELCERIKAIDLRFTQDDEEEFNNGNIPYVKCGMIEKKSDHGNSWEQYGL